MFVLIYLLSVYLVIGNFLTYFIHCDNVYVPNFNIKNMVDKFIISASDHIESAFDDEAYNDISNEDDFFEDFSDYHHNEMELDCSARIYRKCIRAIVSEHEVEIARQYLHERFDAYDTVKPPCGRLHVRKEIKCLTRRELSELVDAMKALYDNGVWERLSRVHSSYWPVYHKFAETILWHRWIINVMELELKKVNPKVSMPYWDFITEFANPEKSIVWDWFGHSGDRHNDFCVKDGYFANQYVGNPEHHCVRRQWNDDGTVTPWENPEWQTSFLQTAKNLTEFRPYLGFTAHFKPHLSIGGYYGDFSISIATNDPVFYFYHNYIADYMLLKWQLTDDSHLVPQEYSEGKRYDIESEEVVQADLDRDHLALFDSVTVKETFEVGFGEMCYIHDSLVRDINDMLEHNERKPPAAIKRLRDALPPHVFRKYFPKFADGSATLLDFELPDVGDCQGFCEMPLALAYNDTANGRRQLRRFREDLGVDDTPLTFRTENSYYRFMHDISSTQYCSPYVS